jgi:pimeloyl-ACP methyl ester carboxylesterase
MMDSHLYKKAANRLPAMAGIEVIRFNTRGTSSEAGTSTGEFDNGISEKFDVEAMMSYCLDTLKLENLWVVGWSFGTDLAQRHAKDPRVKGLILLSPTLRTTEVSDLQYWAAQAIERFKPLTQVEIIPVEGAKHLWVGEPAVHRVLSEITKIIAPGRLPLPTEI